MGRLVDQSHIHYRSQVIEVDRSEAIPDPTSGEDGEVLGIEGGAYDLIPSGGEQTIRLRTFIVNYNDPGIDDYTLVLWTPVAGEVILDLWCYPTVAFDGADAAKLYIGGDQFFDALLARGLTTPTGGPDLIGIPPAGVDRDFGMTGDRQSNVTLDARSSHLRLTNGTSDTTVASRPLLSLPAVTGTNGTNVVAQITVTNGPLTSGTLVVSALTAEPVT